VTDVIPPDVARTMVAMLEDVVQFGTGVRAKTIARPTGGKTGTTNDFTDAWYIGFTPQITAGVWVGNDDKRVSLGKAETGAQAALPIWIEFMQQGMQGMPVVDFPNVIPLEKLAGTQEVQVDTPDTAPPADVTEQGLTETSAPSPSTGDSAKRPGKPTGRQTEKPPAAIPQKISTPRPTASGSPSPTASSPTTTALAH